VTTTQQPSPSEVDLGTREFFLWALATLQLPAETHDDGVFEVRIPADRQGDFEGRDSVRFTFDPDCLASHAGIVLLTACSPLGRDILEQLARSGPTVHAVPQTQSVNVPELTSRLFEAYTVQGGSLRLGGLSLEDRPLLRYTYAVRSPDGGAGTRLVHVYASSEGRPIDEELLSALGARQLVPLHGRPPRMVLEQNAQWQEFGQQHAPLVAEGDQSDFLLATAIWCKFALGKVFFEIGDSRAETDFQGWAQLLVEGSVLPPPFRCPATGLQSHQLLAMEDGRITVPEAVTVCEESGRRVLTSDLEACCITNRRVLPEYLLTCPVSGDRLLQSVTVTCTQCRQAVSPRSIRGGRCAACRSMEAVPRDDPRVARVLGEYERLDRWGHWRLAETSRTYVLTARTLLRRLLVVVDKESLQIAHLADAGRFSSNWSDVLEVQRRDYLG
jgi:hypothetical protein